MIDNGFLGWSEAPTQGDRFAELQSGGREFPAPPDDTRFGGLPDVKVVYRDYTNAEKAAISFQTPETPEARLLRRVQHCAADILRYTQAAMEYPDLASHCARLTDCTQQALTAWEKHYVKTLEIGEQETPGELQG